MCECVVNIKSITLVSKYKKNLNIINYLKVCLHVCVFCVLKAYVARLASRNAFWT